MNIIINTKRIDSINEWGNFYDENDKEKIDGKIIKTIPIWQWLMNK